MKDGNFQKYRRGGEELGYIINRVWGSRVSVCRVSHHLNGQFPDYVVCQLLLVAWAHRDRAVCTRLCARPVLHAFDLWTIWNKRRRPDCPPNRRSRDLFLIFELICWKHNFHCLSRKFKSTVSLLVNSTRKPIGAIDHHLPGLARRCSSP